MRSLSITVSLISLILRIQIMHSLNVAFHTSSMNRLYSNARLFSRESASIDQNESESGADEGIDLRFLGVGRLYANKQQTETPNKETILSRLSSATVAVIGLGGVGSWSAEALVRSGIGNIILIDLDDICISNSNRQLHAMTSTVGKMKIDEMERRLVDINPKVNVTLIHDFITIDNANTIIKSLLPQVTAIIDAIDGMYEKTALILACVENQIPLVTCGGAAGRMDPTKVVIDDLTKVQEDRLLFKCRKLLRQQYGFPKVPIPKTGKKERIRNWRIYAVYSTEVQQKVAQQEYGSLRTCDGALGTACFVTGTYGFVAASKIVEMIAIDGMVVPKKPPRQRVERISVPRELLQPFGEYPNLLNITEDMRSHFHPVIKLPHRESLGGDISTSNSLGEVYDYIVKDFTGLVDNSMIIEDRKFPQLLPTREEAVEHARLFPSNSMKGYDVGRYDENRLGMYTSSLFGDSNSDDDRRRTVHVGIDIGAPVGTEVYAFEDGIVHSVGYNPDVGDYGHVIVIKHMLSSSTKIYALYGHLAKSVLKAKAGETITKGQVIGHIGNTDENGGWTGTHLHFQVAVNPPTKEHDMPGTIRLVDRHFSLLEYIDPRYVLGELY